jgi:hypothetical protein
MNVQIMVLFNFVISKIWRNFPIKREISPIYTWKSNVCEKNIQFLKKKSLVKNLLKVEICTINRWTNLSYVVNFEIAQLSSGFHGFLNLYKCWILYSYSIDAKLYGAMPLVRDFTFTCVYNTLSEYNTKSNFDLPMEKKGNLLTHFLTMPNTLKLHARIT